MILKIIIAIFLVDIFFRDLRFMGKSHIATKKSILDKLVMVIGVAVLAYFTYRYGKSITDYILGLLFVIFMLLMILKQGISENGLLIGAKGKELFKWEELYCAEYQKSDSIIVTFYSAPCTDIVKHHFRLEDEERLLTMLSEHIQVSELTR